MNDICTGEYLDPEFPQGAVGPCGFGGPCVIGGEPVNNVLFDGNSTSVISRTFQVSEGACVQLTAYSLGGGTIQVQKLYLDPTANIPVTEAGSCDVDPDVPGPGVLAVKNVCNWVLNDCQDIRYICAAGTYRLCLSPPGALGSAFVVMERSQRTNNPIPEGMVLGACC